VPHSLVAAVVTAAVAACGLSQRTTRLPTDSFRHPRLIHQLRRKLFSTMQLSRRNGLEQISVARPATLELPQSASVLGVLQAPSTPEASPQTRHRQRALNILILT